MNCKCSFQFPPCANRPRLLRPRDQHLKQVWAASVAPAPPGPGSRGSIETSEPGGERGGWCHQLRPRSSGEGHGMAEAAAVCFGGKSPNVLVCYTVLGKLYPLPSSDSDTLEGPSRGCEGPQALPRGSSRPPITTAPAPPPPPARPSSPALRKGQAVSAQKSPFLEFASVCGKQQAEVI